MKQQKTDLTRHRLQWSLADSPPASVPVGPMPTADSAWFTTRREWYWGSESQSRVYHSPGPDFTDPVAEFPWGDMTSEMTRPAYWLNSAGEGYFIKKIVPQIPSQIHQNLEPKIWRD